MLEPNFLQSADVLFPKIDLSFDFCNHTFLFFEAGILGKKVSSQNLCELHECCVIHRGDEFLCDWNAEKTFVPFHQIFKPNAQLEYNPMDNQENQQLPVSVAEPTLAKEQDKPDRSSSSSQSSYSQQSNASVSHSSINSRDKEDQSRTIRYKYCCKTCKHPDKSKKACVCVVPLSQRRTDLGGGCRNCGCKGCSKEDFLKKGQDPEYKPSETRQFLPQKVGEFYRKEQKPMDNNSRRFGNNTNMMTGATIRERSRSNRRIKSPRRRRSSSSRSKSREMIDTLSMKFYNIDRSLLGNMIINEFQINPCLLGFGVPQRSQSYIMGRPK